MRAMMMKLAVVLAMTVPFSAAHAEDMLTGDQIRELVSGNTIAGAMLESGAYAEFYQEDGTIRGDGYTGMWSIDGDTMCFQYGEDPASCWNVSQDGETIQWVQDGAVAGDGMVAEGNTNGF